MGLGPALCHIHVRWPVKCLLTHLGVGSWAFMLGEKWAVQQNPATLGQRHTGGNQASSQLFITMIFNMVFH